MKRFMITCGLMFCLVSSPLQAAPDAVTFGVVVERGDTTAAKKWLDEGLDPNFIGDRIGTGMMIGAWEGNIEMMELFLKYGASVNFTNRLGEQAVQLAAWKGQKKAVEWLLDHGADVNRKGREWSALHYAVFAGHTDLAKNLVEWGADINARTPNGSTPLMMAVREGHEEIVQNLLDEGADARLLNDASENALIWAMRHNRLKIAKLVSSQPEFAQAVKAPPQSFGPATRSEPAPDEIAQLLKQIEAAERASLPSDELKKRFYTAMDKYRREHPPLVSAQKGSPASAPSAMVISAKKGKKGQERAELVYDSKNAKTPTGKNAGKNEKNEKSAAAIAKADKERQAKQAKVANLMQDLRQAEAQGRPTDEIRTRLFQASDALK